jgi:hypothetical protein
VLALARVADCSWRGENFPLHQLSDSQGGEVMEKISRIVPGNSRVAAVDMKNAAPVRPGTPSFGRPLGESTMNQAKGLSTADRAVALHKEMNDRRMANTHQTIAQNMADRFFMNRLRQPAMEEPVDNVSMSGLSIGEEAETEVSMAPNEDVEDLVDPMLPESPTYTPRGSFLDVQA